MLKMKKMAILAVVALGLVALAAPAGASAKSKSIERLNKDVQRLGNNVSDLRKKTDEMNNTIASLANTAGRALTQLQDGLVTLSNTTANFKYGVVQIATTSGAGSTSAGLGPQWFYATPPMYKTGEQSTVTFGVPATGTTLEARIAVRSLNPDNGTVGCRVSGVGGLTGAGSPGIAGNSLRTRTASGAVGYFKAIPQSRIAPQNGDTSFPFALVPTEDKVIDMFEPNDLDIGQRPYVNGPMTVTLSCIVQ